jgi:hypothetical protein
MKKVLLISLLSFFVIPGRFSRHSRAASPVIPGRFSRHSQAASPVIAGLVPGIFPTANLQKNPNFRARARKFLLPLPRTRKINI